MEIIIILGENFKQKKLTSFLKDLGSLLKQVTGNKKAYIHLMQRFYIAIQRGNCASVLGSILVHLLTEYQSFIHNILLFTPQCLLLLSLCSPQKSCNYLSLHICMYYNNLHIYQDHDIGQLLQHTNNPFHPAVAIARIGSSHHVYLLLLRSIDFVTFFQTKRQFCIKFV